MVDFHSSFKLKVVEERDEMVLALFVVLLEDDNTLLLAFLRAGFTLTANHLNLLARVVLDDSNANITSEKNLESKNRLIRRLRIKIRGKLVGAGTVVSEGGAVRVTWSTTTIPKELGREVFCDVSEGKIRERINTVIKQRFQATNEQIDLTGQDH